MIKKLNSAPSIPAAFFQIAAEHPDREVWNQSIVHEDESENEPRPRRSSTYSEVATRVTKLAHFLKATGLSPEDTAAIFSSSRPEWMEADLAILAAGGITASIYQSLPADDAGYILFDSGAEYIFAENQEQVDKLLELLKEPIAIPGTEEREAMSVQIGIKKIIAFDPVAAHPLVSQFDEIVSGGPGSTELEAYKMLGRDDLATLVYTSGTTGPPKGVMQSHGNHLSNCRQAWECGLIDSDSSIMLFLPLAHSFARLMGYLGFLTPARLAFPGIADKKTSKMNPASVTRDIAEAGATIVPLVPRLLEKMQAGIKQKSLAPGLGGKILTAILWSAAEVYNPDGKGKAPSVLAQLVFKGTAGIRAKIKAKLFGQEILYCISGGAKLNPTVARFFDMLEIEILEGYGLTETCVATNINRLGAKKIGSVGPVLAQDIELRLSEDGEILFRGPNIALGYYNREIATAEAWDREGWFHTGDLGAVDDDGFLSIVGRKKEILVTSYGKNIAPEGIEGQLKTSVYVSQALLVGDGRPYCTALVTVDLETVRGWAKKLGISCSDSELLADERLQSLIWKETEKVNSELASYESVKKIAIIPEEFTVDNGLLTPTFKVKRNLVLEKYDHLVENLYAE